MNAPRSSRLPLLAFAGLVALALAALVMAQTGVATERIAPDDLIDRVARGDDLLILDVRTVEEFTEGRVPGAVNIPHTELSARLDEIAAAGDVEIVLYCRSGRRAEIAAGTLREAGYERLLHLDGDMQGWELRQLPVVRDPGS
jgi:rhodanese-related sulfurtransferase